MTMPQDTAKEIYATLNRHLTGKQIYMVLLDLSTAQGSKFLRDTVGILLELHAGKNGKGLGLCKVK
jgi:hypothetical protein